MAASYTESVKKYLGQRSAGDEFSDLSIITVNVTDYCQLACSYCPHSCGYKPRGDMDFYTAYSLASRIEESGFKGRVSISGNGEPTLWPYLFQFLMILPEEVDKQVISNGMTEGFDYGRLGEMCRLIISQHDKNAELKIGNARCIIRDCTPGSHDLKLTNRGGALGGDKKNRGLCTFPFYKIFVDYDGSYLLCPDDWLRKSREEGCDIFHLSLRNYFCDVLQEKKRELIEQGRIAEPCISCTANGQVMGNHFVERFEERHVSTRES